MLSNPLLIILAEQFSGLWQHTDKISNGNNLFFHHLHIEDKLMVEPFVALG